MANKEKLELLTGYIHKLSKLTESVYEREIYPVSFFSQAYDITNKIQDSLHQIEVEQVELFEHQMKEHLAQIELIQQLKKKNTPSNQEIPLFEQIQSIKDNNSTLYSVNENEPTSLPDENEKDEQQILLQTSIDEKQLSELDIINSYNEKSPLADFRKAFTLNDRFRFCRELFSSNENFMNQTISELNNLESYNDSVLYIKEHFDWNLDDGIVTEFIMLIEKRFE